MYQPRDICGNYDYPYEFPIQEIPHEDDVPIIDCERCEEVIVYGDHDYEEIPGCMRQCPSCDTWRKIEHHPRDIGSSYSHNMALLEDRKSVV